MKANTVCIDVRRYNQLLKAEFLLQQSEEAAPDSKRLRQIEGIADALRCRAELAEERVAALEAELTTWQNGVRRFEVTP